MEKIIKIEFNEDGSNYTTTIIGLKKIETVGVLYLLLKKIENEEPIKPNQNL